MWTQWGWGRWWDELREELDLTYTLPGANRQLVGRFHKPGAQLGAPDGLKRWGGEGVGGRLKREEIYV